MYVREKVRVESVDFSFMSLIVKFMVLMYMLSLVRRNLVVVMGEEMED